MGQKVLMPLKIISNFMFFFLGDHFHFFLERICFVFFHDNNEKNFVKSLMPHKFKLHVLKVMAHITPFFKIFRQTVVNCDLQSFKKNVEFFLG